MGSGGVLRGFFGGAELLMRAAGRRAGGESWAWMAFLRACWRRTLPQRAFVLGFGQFVCVGAAGAARRRRLLVLCRAGLLTEGATGPFAALDALRALVLYPFGRFFLRVRVVWYGLKGARCCCGAPV